MNFVKVLSCLVLLATSRAVSAVNVELPTLIMQLRSTIDTSNSQLLSEMLTLTTQYLDSYFGAYYSNVQPVDYFSHTALSVNSFGIHGVEGSYITTLEFDGMLLFSSEPLPSQEFVTTLLANAFQHLNQEMYLTTLLTSKNEFLTSLTHVIIEVDDSTVTEENMDERKKAAGDDKDWLEGEWLIMVVYGTAGLAGAVLLVCLVLVCRCLICKDRRQVDEIGYDDRAGGTIPNKLFVEPPRANQNQKSSRNHKNKPETPMSVADADMYTTVEAPTRSGSRSPSPARSIASQDSSKFTYNHNPMNMSKGSLASMSNLQIDMPSMELDPWQNSDTISPITPAPFGNDISAIEHQDKEKDLSLIEEGDDEDSFGASAIAAAVAARKNRFRKALDSSQSSGYGSRTGLGSSSLEVRNSRSRNTKTTSNSTTLPSHLSLSSVAAMSYPRSTNHMHGSMLGPSNESFSQEDSKSIVSDSSSDVINDLRNLSLQIDRHRRGRSGGY